MDRSTMVRTGVAGAVAGLGLAAGGIAVASADTPTATPGTSEGRPPAGRPDGRHDGQLAASLAKALGLKEAAVQKALDAAQKDLRPAEPAAGTRPTPPTDAQRAARQDALATALAKSLDVSKDEVVAALAAAEKQSAADRAEHKTQERADLVTRLDTAVKAGTLTEADKTSVLKAYDANLLGGGGRGGPGGPGGHGGPGGAPGTAPEAGPSPAA